MSDEPTKRRPREIWEILRNQAGLPQDTKPADVYAHYHGHCANQEQRLYGSTKPWRWDEMHNDLTNVGMADDEAERLVVRTLGMRPEKVVSENTDPAVDTNRQAGYLAAAKGAEQ